MWCTCEVVVLLIKPIVFLTFSLSSASLDLKVPNDTINNGQWISILENQVYIYVSFNCSPLCKLESIFFFSNGKCVNACTWLLLLLHCVEGDSHFQNKKYRFPYLTNQSNTVVPYQMEIILWFLLWNNLLPTEAQLFQPFLHSAPHPP